MVVVIIEFKSVENVLLPLTEKGPYWEELPKRVLLTSDREKKDVCPTVKHD